MIFVKEIFYFISFSLYSVKEEGYNMGHIVKVQNTKKRKRESWLDLELS